MAYTAADILQADKHIAQGERHVVRQEELISRLRAHNLPTTEAESLLDSFRATLHEHREHRALMVRSMGESD